MDEVANVRERPPRPWAFDGTGQTGQKRWDPWAPGLARRLQKGAATMRLIDLENSSTCSTPLAPKAPGARLWPSVASWLPGRGNVAGRLGPLRARSLVVGGRNLAALALVSAGALGLAYAAPDVAAGSRSAPLVAFATAPVDGDAVDLSSSLAIAALAAGGILLLLPSRRN
jgi:hypothetical protein